MDSIHVLIIIVFVILFIVVIVWCSCNRGMIDNFISDDKKKVLSISCYGYGNIGDNMYSGVIGEYLKDTEFKRIRMDNLYIDHNGDLTETKPKNDYPFDALIVGGGGLFIGDRSFIKPGTPMVHYMELAIQNKKPIYFISCGVQGKTKQFGNFWKRVWNYASLITVRSPTDRDIIKDNCPKANVKYCRDLGYIAPHCGKWNISKRPQKNMTIIVSGPANPQSDEIKSIVKSNRPEEVVVMNMGARTDKDMKLWIDAAEFNIPTTKIYGAAPAPEYSSSSHVDSDLDIQKTFNIILSSLLVLSGRYHGMVFSRSLKIPCETLGMSTNKIRWELPIKSLNDTLRSSYNNIRLLRISLGLPNREMTEMNKILGSVNRL